MVYVAVRKIILPLIRPALRDVFGAANLPTRGPYILASNHIDFMDGFMITEAVYRSRGHAVFFLSKTNNYWWTRATIQVDPKNRSSSLDDAIKYLHQGKVICNFVEGQRNASRHLLPGKTGTARLALLANVPVIPVGIVGPTPNNFAQSLTNVLTERNSVSVRFGPQVELGDLASRGHDQAAVHEATHRIMRGLAPLAGKAYAR